MKKYYIGIDPDLRLLNAAIVDENKKPLAVFVRRNPHTNANWGDVAVANAARMSCRLIEDVIAFFIACHDCSKEGHCEVVTIVESQNMMHAKRMRDSGKNVKYQDILMTGHVAGCLMGAFSNMSDRLLLLQPMEWKKGVPKKVAHKRYYDGLNMEPVVGQVKNIFPLIAPELEQWSHDKINPGDYLDINDSLGLALYGAKKGL